MWPKTLFFLVDTPNHTGGDLQRLDHRFLRHADVMTTNIFFHAASIMERSHGTTIRGRKTVSTSLIIVGGGGGFYKGSSPSQPMCSFSMEGVLKFQVLESFESTAEVGRRVMILVPLSLVPRRE